MLDKALKEATDICKDMDEYIDKETQEKMFDNVNKDGGKQAGNLSPDYIRKVTQELTKLRISMGSLKEKIKKLLDKSASYFSSRKVTTYEDLFNSDNLAGLNDYIELHPKLRKVFIEDILVKEEKSIGKLDIYIDISGSMSDNCGVEDTNGQRISKLDFCKAFTMKLKEMDMLNDVYLFNTSVTKYSSDPIALAMLDTCGGTKIDNAISRIDKEGINAIVITDAEDRCNSFSDKAFFIGVKGANFNYFNSDVIEKYSENNQVVVFDGTRIYNVDNNGHVLN
jgi:predicted metal-dependent peptidase